MKVDLFLNQHDDPTVVMFCKTNTITIQLSEIQDINPLIFYIVRNNAGFIIIC